MSAVTVVVSASQRLRAEYQLGPNAVAVLRSAQAREPIPGDVAGGWVTDCVELVRLGLLCPTEQPEPDADIPLRLTKRGAQVAEILFSEATPGQ